MEIQLVHNKPRISWILLLTVRLSKNLRQNINKYIIEQAVDGVTKLMKAACEG